MIRKIHYIQMAKHCRAMMGLASLCLLVACVEQVVAPKENPVNAELVTFVLNLNLSAENGESYVADERNFRRYIKEYLRRGRSKLVFATSANASIKTERAIFARLISRGVPHESIVVKRGKAKGTGIQVVEFSFKGYVVSVPKCGNWFGETGHNPTNKSHVNFGCSYYRNLGLMLSDPGDLTSPQGISESDGRRMDKAIRVFRDGSAAGSTLPKSESGKVAGPSSN